jgi:hypothetical protein
LLSRATAKLCEAAKAGERSCVPAENKVDELIAKHIDLLRKVEFVRSSYLLNRRTVDRLPERNNFMEARLARQPEQNAELLPLAKSQRPKLVKPQLHSIVFD